MQGCVSLNFEQEIKDILDSINNQSEKHSESILEHVSSIEIRSSFLKSKSA